jgi:hypothetical protein
VYYRNECGDSRYIIPPRNKTTLRALSRLKDMANYDNRSHGFSSTWPMGTIHRIKKARKSNMNIQYVKIDESGTRLEVFVDGTLYGKVIYNFIDICWQHGGDQYVDKFPTRDEAGIALIDFVNAELLK